MTTPRNNGSADPFDDLRRAARQAGQFLNPWEPIVGVTLHYPNAKPSFIHAQNHPHASDGPPPVEEPEWEPTRAQRKTLLALAGGKRLSGVALKAKVGRNFYDKPRPGHDAKGGVQELMREGLVDVDAGGDKDIYFLTEVGEAEALRLGEEGERP